MQVNNSSQQLGELCTALVRRLRFLERSELSCCGIPMSQAMVLQTLSGSKDGQRMSAIAEALGVAQSTATRLVEPLVRQGRVERKAAVDDGRSVFIVLTDEGRQAADELGELSLRWSESVMQRIPLAQQSTVIAALESVLEAVSDCCSAGCAPQQRKQYHDAQDRT